MKKNTSYVNDKIGSLSLSALQNDPHAQFLICNLWG